MATMTTSPTFPQLEQLTRTGIIKRFLRDTGLGITGTVTGVGGGATVTFDDTTRLKSTQYDVREWFGGWARISSAANSTAQNVVSPVTLYDPVANGRITINPALPAAITVGDTYELWRNPHPQIVLDFIDELLTEELYFPCWTPLTEIPDGDMEQSNTTDWTNSNATLTKQTGEPAMMGKRYLRVVTTSAHGYATHANAITVTPGKTYHFSVLARANSGYTCEVIAYDVTNSTALQTVTYAGYTNARIYLDINVPTTCKSISFRMGAVENSATVHYDDAVGYPEDASDIRLPWWVRQRGQVLQTFKLSPTVIVTNVWDWNLQGDIDNAWDIQDRFYGGGQLRVQNRYAKRIGDTPLYIFGLRNETAYSDDNTDIKLVDSNTLVSGLAYKVYDYLSNNLTTGQQNPAAYIANRDRWQKIYYQYQGQQSENIRKALKAPTTHYLAHDTLDFLRYR